MLKSDLDNLSAFLKQNFDYDTGGYQGYDFTTPAKRFILKGDYNLNDTNKITFRYNQLDSIDGPVAVEFIVASGSARAVRTPTCLNFQSSNYAILENIKSSIGEWNSVIGTSDGQQPHRRLTSHDESRGNAAGPFFPFVDILEARHGLHVVRLRAVHAEQRAALQDLPAPGQLHASSATAQLTFGGTAERYQSDNVF